MRAGVVDLVGARADDVEVAQEVCAQAGRGGLVAQQPLADQLGLAVRRLGGRRGVLGDQVGRRGADGRGAGGEDHEACRRRRPASPRAADDRAGDVLLVGVQRRAAPTTPAYLNPARWTTPVTGCSSSAAAHERRGRGSSPSTNGTRRGRTRGGRWRGRRGRPADARRPGTRAARGRRCSRHRRSRRGRASHGAATLAARPRSRARPGVQVRYPGPMRTACSLASRSDDRRPDPTRAATLLSGGFFVPETTTRRQNARDR